MGLYFEFHCCSWRYSRRAVEILFVGLPGKSRFSRLFPSDTPVHMLRAFVDVTVAEEGAQVTTEDGESVSTLQDLRTGFPPQSLMTANSSSTLSDLGLRGRETIRVIWT